MAAELRCRICANAVGNREYAVREMMFGTRQVFNYFQCSRCGCLQIAAIPADMRLYYPSGYRCFLNRELAALRSQAWSRWLRRMRTRYALSGAGMAGRIVHTFFPLSRPLTGVLRWIWECRLSIEARILDVGCGGGEFLAQLDWHGFNRLTGIDPFLERDRQISRRARLCKRDIFSQEGVFDLVIFNHSFEHMADPRAVLAHAASLLSAEGWIILRTPTVSSQAWETYRQDWAQIDAPRHLYVHSPDSLARLAAAAGLKTEKVIFDSTAFQFWASEQYRRDIPLTAPAVFTAGQIAAFEREAQCLNQQQRGDQVALFLRRRS